MEYLRWLFVNYFDLRNFNRHHSVYNYKFILPVSVASIRMRFMTLPEGNGMAFGVLVTGNYLRLIVDYWCDRQRVNNLPMMGEWSQEWSWLPEQMGYIRSSHSYQSRNNQLKTIKIEHIRKCTVIQFQLFVS